MKIILLKSFTTVVEAEAAKNFLQAHSIKVIFQTGKPGMTGYGGNISGGELYVREDELEKALGLLP